MICRCLLNTAKQLQIIYPFKRGKNEISLEYTATPKQALYFVGSEAADDLQIWTQDKEIYQQLVSEF
jgi:aminopeptidase N